MDDEARKQSEIDAVGRVVFVLVWLGIAALCLYVAVLMALPAWQAALGMILIATVVAGSASDRARKGRRRKLA